MLELQVTKILSEILIYCLFKSLGVKITAVDFIMHLISRENLLRPLDGLLFSISTNGSFICIIPEKRQYILQPLLAYTSCRALARTRNNSIGQEGGIDPMT